MVINASTYKSGYSGSSNSPLALEIKSVTPTKSEQTVTPDSGYDGLSKVNVGAIPDEYVIPSGEKRITENGSHDVAGYASVDVAVGSNTISLQAKTVNPSASAQTVTPDSGYDGLSQVTVNAMKTAAQATPSIEVSSDGLITAKATQAAGYVSAGTKSSTKQLATQAEQTVTPGTSDKTIASGRYLTGPQTIKGDANLVAENIKSGVSIFGVIGSYEGSGSGGGNSAVGGDFSVTLYFYDTDSEMTSCKGFYIINGDFESGGEQIPFDASSIFFGSNFGADSKICVYLYWTSFSIRSSGCAADYTSQKYVYDQDGNEYPVLEIVITEIESDAVLDVYEG